MSNSDRFSVIGPDGFIHHVIVWDGETPWNPCHEDDIVILSSNYHVGPGDRYENGNFIMVENKVDQEPLDAVEG